MGAIYCPKCGKPAEASGLIDFDGQSLTVYQCSICTVACKFGGETLPTAVTFAVDADVNCFNPITLEPFALPPDPPSDN